MPYAIVDSDSRFIVWSYEYIDGGTEFPNPETVEDSFRGEVSDFKLVGGVAVFEPTPERQQEIEKRESESDAQDVIEALPDAVAELSEMVSDNATDVADIMDAIAELSEIVSTLVEGA